jgi:chromosome segregation ATPase
MSLNNLISNIELKLKDLLSSYNRLKSENTELHTTNSSLSLELEENRKQISLLNDKIKIMSISKSVDVSKEDIKDTKLKINEYIREIDKCIALLNN